VKNPFFGSPRPRSRPFSIDVATGFLFRSCRAPSISQLSCPCRRRYGPTDFINSFPPHSYDITTNGSGATEPVPTTVSIFPEPLCLTAARSFEFGIKGYAVQPVDAVTRSNLVFVDRHIALEDSDPQPAARMWSKGQSDSRIVASPWQEGSARLHTGVIVLLFVT